MKNEKCVKDESHSEFTKEEQEEFLNLLGRITPEQREALKKVLKSFLTTWDRLSPSQRTAILDLIQAFLPE